MTTSRWQLIQELFAEATKLMPEQRSAMLSERCGQDEQLRSEVESLLTHDRPESTFLEPRTEIDTTPKASDSDSDVLIGMEVGACTLARLIGTGGMGAVYEGRQHDPDRAVAVKLLTSLAWSFETRRRFQFETRVLALLDHPGIARIHHAGTMSLHGPNRELPYFVMEYIPKAAPVTQYAARNQVGIQGRLRLFLLACEAVQYAHSKGVIHRDLKPQNILVDAEGRLKVIDFGIAKATKSDLVVTTLRTDFGQLIGTLQYMSPEQCVANPDEIDTRSDVYSLGVVLYELLCDQVPYDIAKTPVGEATRIIREQAPRDPLTVAPGLGKNLNAIILKALHKKPHRRYLSVGEFAADIRRHLNGEPITARPPTVITRAAYWTARHPSLATAIVCTSIAITVVVLTTAAITLGLRRPARIEHEDDGTEARLVSVVGEPLRVWTAQGSDNIIRMAKLLEQPEALGGRRLAVIAFADAFKATAFPHALCAFDVDRDWEQPFWHRQIEDDTTRKILQAGRATRDDFNVVAALAGEVFPEQEGSEIVAIHQHVASTRSVIRVYDLAGAVQYQVWVDAQILGLYWMHEEQLLILAGLNGSGTWQERGESPAKDPLVIFALQPERELMTYDHLSDAGGAGPQPTWYRCVKPAEMTRVFRLKLGCLTAPRHDPGQFVRFTVHSIREFEGVSASVDWVINGSGDIVPGSMTWNQEYTRYQAELPDKTALTLGELPALVPMPLTAGSE